MSTPRRTKRASGRQRVDPLDQRLDAIQRWTIVLLLAGVPVVIWRSGVDPFILPKATLVWVGAVVLLVCEGVRVVWGGIVRVPRCALAVALGAFGVAAIVTTVLSPHAAIATVGEFERNAGLGSYLSYVVVAGTVLMRFGGHDVRLAMRAVVIGSALPAAYAILQWADADPWTWTTFGFADVFSTFGNANLLAGYAGVAAPFALWGLIDRGSTVPWRAFSGTVLAAILLASWASESFQGPAAASIGCGVVLLVWLWRTMASRSGSPPQVRWVAAGFVGLALLASILLAGPARAEVEDGLGERKYFWPAALEVFESHPLIGTGLDTFGQHFLQNREREHAVRFGDSVADSPHSVPVGMLSGGGLLLALAYASIVAVTVVVLAHSLRGKADLDLVGALGGAWVAYQLQSLVSMDVPPVALLHFFIASALYVVYRSSRSGVTTLNWAAFGNGPVRQRVGYGAVAVAGLFLAFVALVPLRADVAAGIGYRRAAAGDVAGGLSLLADATDVAPWRSRYWLLRTAVLDEVQDYRTALDTAEEAARREPGSSEYAIFAARIADQLSENERAAHWYWQAVQRNPESHTVLAEAVMWADEHDPTWRLNAAKRWTEVASHEPNAWIFLARAERATGDERSALAAYRRALAINPQDEEAAEAVAMARSTAGSPSG